MPLKQRTGRPGQIGLRQRLIRGAGAQVVAHVTRVVVQFGQAGVLLPTWGLERYGEWLMLVGIGLFLAGSDFGFITATVSDMNVAVARGDREHALDAFRTTARGLAIGFVLALLLGAVLVAVLPLDSILGLHGLSHATAAAILIMAGIQVMLVVSSMLFYGGFSSEGHYGEGIAIQSVLTAAESCAAWVAALLGGSPLIATAAWLGTRMLGVVGMYVAMRRRAPWLSLGRPNGRAQVAKRLTRPALSMAAIGWGTALNIQGMVVVVGLTTGAASAAVFATVRTLSRVIVQLGGSIGQAVGPEVARAYGEGRSALVAKLQRRVNQMSAWSTLVLIVLLSAIGPVVVHIWTRGHVEHTWTLLVLLLAGAGLEAIWLNAGTTLFFTNRHVKIGGSYAIVTVASIPLAYILASGFGRDGAAISLLIVSILMLARVLRLSLQDMNESVANWLRSLAAPGVSIALRNARAQLTAQRGS